jgi:hypothetical protein
MCFKLLRPERDKLAQRSCPFLVRARFQSHVRRLYKLIQIPNDGAGPFDKLGVLVNELFVAQRKAVNLLLQAGFGIQIASCSRRGQLQGHS